MGDSRFYLKGTFSIYGEDFPFDWSLNWYDDGYGHGIDDRIVQFFRESYEKAHWKYTEDERKGRAKRAEKEKERLERDELKRLQEKYGPVDATVTKAT